MRLIFIFFVSILLTACMTLKNAEDAYQNGDYLHSVNLGAQFLEKKGPKKLSQSDYQRFYNIVANVTAHYDAQVKSATRTDYQTRIEGYTALLTIKNRVSYHFYSQTIQSLTNKYNLSQLHQHLAEEYYLYGNSITTKDADSYLLQAKLYQKGMEYYRYKDIEARYKQAQTNYMQTAAADYYQMGKKLAAQNQPKQAAEYFSKAIDVHKPLGKYKDSEKHFTENDKKYRTAEAENLYQKAKKLIPSASTFRQYRDISSLFVKADEQYRRYGKFKDALALAKHYKQKGTFSVFIEQSDFQSEIKQKLKGDVAFELTNTPSSAYVIISAKKSVTFDEKPATSTIQAMSENVVSGTTAMTNPQTGQAEQHDQYKTHYFNQKTITTQNELQLTVTLSASGAFSYTKELKVTEQSAKMEYLYTGDVPSQYKSHTNDKLLSKAQLKQKAEDALKSQISAEIDTLIKRIHAL